MIARGIEIPSRKNYGRRNHMFYRVVKKRWFLWSTNSIRRKIYIWLMNWLRLWMTTMFSEWWNWFWNRAKTVWYLWPRMTKESWVWERKLSLGISTSNRIILLNESNTVDKLSFRSQETLSCRNTHNRRCNILG